MKQLTRTQAIRKKCLACSCGSYKEVRLCPLTDCPLYPYRFGYQRSDRHRVVAEQKCCKTTGKGSHSDASSQD